MPIAMLCLCGRRFRIKDELAGKRILCPSCQAVLDVPRGDEQPCVVVASAVSQEERQLDDYLAKQPAGHTEAGSEDLPAAPRKRRAADSGDDIEPRRRRRRKNEGWFGRTHAGVFGGLLMILIAIIWFVGGLCFNFIFFYPPILLLIGVIAVIKGLMSSSD